jgi:hypothetical protein
MATLSKPSLSINHDHNKKLAKVVVTGKITYSEYELNQMKDGLKYKLKCALWGEDSGLTGADDHLFTLPSKYFPDSSPAMVENYKFEVTLGEGVLDEDWGTDEVYAQLKLVNLYTLIAVTKNSNVVSHSF